MPVEAALGDAGRGGDLVEVDAIDAAAAEQLERGLRQLFGLRRRRGRHGPSSRGHPPIIVSGHTGEYCRRAPGSRPRPARARSQLRESASIGPPWPSHSRLSTPSKPAPLELAQDLADVVGVDAARRPATWLMRDAGRAAARRGRQGLRDVLDVHVLDLVEEALGELDRVVAGDERVAGVEVEPQVRRVAAVGQHLLEPLGPRREVAVHLDRDDDLVRLGDADDLAIGASHQVQRLAVAEALRLVQAVGGRDARAAGERGPGDRLLDVRDADAHAVLARQRVRGVDLGELRRRSAPSCGAAAPGPRSARCAGSSPARGSSRRPRSRPGSM